VWRTYEYQQQKNGIALYECIIYYGYGHWWCNEKTVLNYNYVLLVDNIANKFLIISRSTLCTCSMVLSVITVWWTTAVIIRYAPSNRIWLEVLLRWTFAYEYLKIWTDQKIDNKTKCNISLLIVFLRSFHWLIMSWTQPLIGFSQMLEVV
jgi:membrane glycosyltransferase